MGHANDAEHYLSCYDMGRTDYFYSEDDVKSHSVEQVFTKCVFAKTWTDDGDEKYGIHYCQIIDPAIACGYNEHLKCTHDKHFFKDGQCHFLFEMQDESKILRAARAAGNTTQRPLFALYRGPLTRHARTDTIIW